MKIKKFALLGTASLLIVCGVSTALAMTFSKGTQTYNDSTDSAVILSWGTNDVGNVTNLTSSAYVYRTVVLSNPSAMRTADEQGNVVLTFTLAAKDSGVLTGCDVWVYPNKTVAEVQARNEDAGHVKKATRDVGVDGESWAKVKVNTSTATGTFSVPVTTDADVNFVLEFNYDGTTLAEGAVIGGQLTVSMDYEPAAQA